MVLKTPVYTNQRDIDTNYQNVSKIEKIKNRIEKNLQSSNPEIIDIQIAASSTTLEPRLDFNRSFEEVRPYLSTEEMSEQMVIESCRES